MRHNFSKKTKAAALYRSGGYCEGSGVRYGLEPDQRCNADLAMEPIEFDHWPLGAHAEGSNTLENCVCTCKRCNQYAANHTDKAVEAKLKRVQRKHGRIPDTRKPRPKMESAGFSKVHRPLRRSKKATE